MDRNKQFSVSILQQMKNINEQKENYKTRMEDPNLAGISFKLTALDRLGRKYDAIFYANLLIILLFIVLETAPIVTKLITNAGPYDHLLEAHEHQFKNYKKGKIHMTDLKLDQLVTGNG